MPARTDLSTRTRSSTRSTAPAGLERSEVVDRALAIVEAEGADALTMRRLAAELGVTTTTIYWHVGNRDELLLAVVERLAEQLGRSDVVGRTPHERVRSAAHNIWTNARAHRNVTVLASSLGATTVLELPLEVALVAELEAAGVNGARARDALRSVLFCVAGFLVGAWRPDDLAPEHLRHATLWAGVQDPAISSRTVRAMAERPDVDRLFETSVGAVIDAYLGEPT